MLNTYWFYRKVPESVSHIANILTFVGVTTFPIFGLRNPYITGCGFQFQLFRYYIIGASGGMILISMHLSGANETFNLCLKVAAVLASISTIASCTIKFFFETTVQLDVVVNLPRRASFYGLCVGYKYMMTGARPWMTIARGRYFIFAPKCYLHDSRIKAWLAEKWPVWEINPPSWFDQKFRRKGLHPSIIPKVDVIQSAGRNQENAERIANSAPRDEFSLILAFIRQQNLEKKFQQALDEYSLWSIIVDANNFTKCIKRCRRKQFCSRDAI